ncbi:ATP-dependent protease LonB [archaeon]|nr:ATP-dependent protease LonB [archaeon]
MAPKKKKQNNSLLNMNIKTTADIPIPKKIVDQVVGQEKGVELVKKAARQRRNVFLLGEPGTGKSMLGIAMAELLPISKLQDILVNPNQVDPNTPLITIMEAGKGRQTVEKIQVSNMSSGFNRQLLSFAVFMIIFMIPWILYHLGWIEPIMAAASVIVAGIMGIGVLLGFQLKSKESGAVPKVLVDNGKRKMAPFIEATGARAGALLGDVRHDPLQSGGLGTPAHLRVEVGMIHKAHMGVLFIDEIATLSPKSQQELLTAMQEKKYSITGQSELSSGAMVHTETVPCDFVLVAAGNLADMKKMHPALRSRIRGYGYEIYLNETMEDTQNNRRKIAQFIAQEVKKDGKIPHFTKAAINSIILEARRRAGRKNRLTVKLRELGGLIRASGDVAKAHKAKYVMPEHIEKAKKLARTMEQQIADKYIIQKKEYEVFSTRGQKIGKVNGLGLMGDGGIIIPIEAEITPALSKSEGDIIATGKLGEITKEAVQNVGAIIKKYKGNDISSYDVHVQFLQTYEGVEGDSASVSIATALISALEDIPIKQSIAMTGSLSVRGEVLPVGGITQKVEAAIEAGVKKVIIPKSNEKDVLLTEKDLKGIQIITATNLLDVIEHAFLEGPKKLALLKQIKETHA